ncbi:MAG: hypothetical protein KJO93_00095 [Muriicola sp.]|nr:hypothetical protein [Muriicola sp.]NNC61174.1 hypothetical protein [Eudoraea sp.]NNK21624.1 hypothetical protein [Flavobacteriaceae bacterium]NNK34399.1 hypothetical protein [Eudoraea sp.]
MRQLTVILLMILFISCGQKIEKEDLELLNGYWEISVVEFPSGDKKRYEINTTVDYIEVSGMKGYRKKVQPLPDGSFITSDDAENFSLSARNDAFIMLYNNEMSEWEEEIEQLTETLLVLKNNEQIRYIYRRYHPVILD